MTTPTLLDRLARADADAHSSPAVESAVLAAFDRHYALRTDWRRWGAIAAMLILAVGLSLTVAQRHGSGTRAADSEQRTATAAVRGRAADSEQRAAAAGVSGTRAAGNEPRGATAEVSEFVPWPGASVLPAFEGGELVRTSLPATVLPLLDIPLADAPVVDGHVIADVLYGQDGQPRAVRVVKLTP